MLSLYIALSYTLYLLSYFLLVIFSPILCFSTFFFLFYLFLFYPFSLRIPYLLPPHSPSLSRSFPSLLASTFVPSASLSFCSRPHHPLSLCLFLSFSWSFALTLFLSIVPFLLLFRVCFLFPVSSSHFSRVFLTRFSTFICSSTPSPSPSPTTAGQQASSSFLSDDRQGVIT